MIGWNILHDDIEKHLLLEILQLLSQRGNVSKGLSVSHENAVAVLEPVKYGMRFP